MKTKTGLLFLLLLSLSLPVLAGGGEPSDSRPKDNAELSGIFSADQADRSGPNIDWTQVAPRDKARQARVREMVKAGELHTPADYNHAAFILQHGEAIEDIRLAHSLATIAAVMEPDNKDLRWMQAASWDRLMMYRGQPQWYGTQFNSDAQGWYLFPVAEAAVTDSERQAMGVPTLEQSRQRVAEIATSTGGKVRASAPTLDEIRQQAEHKE